MFKKFTSMITAAILLATGFGIVGPNSANASSPVSSFEVGCSQGPTVGQTTSGVNCSNSIMNAEWQLSNASWSPAVSSTFQTNTVYSVTYRATPLMGFFTVPTISANVFTVNTSYAGSPTGTTVSSLAATAGDPYMTITITFPNTGSGGGGGGGSPSGVIASTSTITEGQVNPTLTFTSNVNFQLMMSNYILDLGTTGLTWNSASTATPNTYVVGLRGTAKGGTISFQAKTTAFSPSLSAPSNTLTFIVPGAISSSSSSSSSAGITPSAASDYLADQQRKAAAVKVARTTLFTTVGSDIAGTLAQYQAADFNIKSAAVLTRVNAKVLALPVAKRNSVDEIEKIIKLENFIEQISNDATQKTITTNQLVTFGLISADNVHKASVTAALKNKDASSLDSMDKISAAIKKELAQIQARRDRTAEIRAQIQARQK